MKTIKFYVLICYFTMLGQNLMSQYLISINKSTNHHQDEFFLINEINFNSSDCIDNIYQLPGFYFHYYVACCKYGTTYFPNADSLNSLDSLAMKHWEDEILQSYFNKYYHINKSIEAKGSIRKKSFNLQINDKQEVTKLSIMHITDFSLCQCSDFGKNNVYYAFKSQPQIYIRVQKK
jgi:hypothetical protein